MKNTVRVLGLMDSKWEDQRERGCQEAAKFLVEASMISNVLNTLAREDGFLKVRLAALRALGQVAVLTRHAAEGLGYASEQDRKPYIRQVADEEIERFENLEEPIRELIEQFKLKT